MVWAHSARSASRPRNNAILAGCFTGQDEMIIFAPVTLRFELQEKGQGTFMKDFAGKIAVITGGGTGMGRELARQLVAEGCNVAMCDVSAEAMAETKRLCEASRLQGLQVTTHVADVSIEDQLKRFRDELSEQQQTDKIHLLFNNAGIGGNGSMFSNS